MDKVGKEHGCGRAMWEYEPELDRLGTPMALMLLPYWTDGCIDSMEGLFFESAASTPYHFLNQSELSARPSRPQRDLPYRELERRRRRDVISRSSACGTTWPSAPPRRPRPTRCPTSTLVAETKPWSATINDNGASSRADAGRGRSTSSSSSALVEPLTHLPAVMTKVPKGGRKWQDAAVEAYTADRRRVTCLFAASGPKNWPRVARPSTQSADEGRCTAPPRSSNIKTSDDRITFDVDRVGVPVVVKSSYFPNWKASGADGPWRVTPNEMVVDSDLEARVDSLRQHAGRSARPTSLTLARLRRSRRAVVVRPPAAAPDDDAGGRPRPRRRRAAPDDGHRRADAEADWLKELAGVGGLGT